MSDRSSDEILDILERRALDSAAEEVIEPEFDVRGALGIEDDESSPEDLTLGGYVAKHDRPAAFDGSDGQPYTVAVDVEEVEDAEEGEPRFAAFLIFIRWAATGAGIMAHVESGDVAYGDTEEEARLKALDLTLYEAKAELDAAIARRQAELED